MSFDTTLVFCVLHLQSYGFFPFSYNIMNQTKTLSFHPILSSWHSKHMSHLSANNLFGMVFHLRNNFHLKDSTSGFPQLFQFYSHIVQGHIPHRITHILGMARLLTMTKLSCRVHPIIVGEVLYQLIGRILCLQYHDV